MYPGGIFACLSFRRLVNLIILAIFWGTACYPQTTRQENHPAAQDDDTKATAVQSRPKSLETRSWDILHQGLAEKAIHNRLMAVTALGNIGPNPRAIELAEVALNDSEPEIRQAAATALGTMKARAAIPRLRTALDDPTPQVGLAAAEALWRIGDRRVRKVLLEVLAGDRPASDSVLKKEMRNAKRKLHDPKGLAILGAEKGAGTLLGPMSFVFPVAKGIIGDKGVSARAATATLLASDQDPKSAKALEEALTDKDWSVRAASAKALGEICRSQFVSALGPLLQDDKPEVRYAASASIIRIKSKNCRGSRQPSQPVSTQSDSAVPPRD
jgi:HEAT repeat protein